MLNVVAISIFLAVSWIADKKVKFLILLDLYLVYIHEDVELEMNVCCWVLLKDVAVAVAVAVAV